MVLRSRLGKKTGCSSQSSSPHCWKRDWQPAMVFRLSMPNQAVPAHAFTCNQLPCWCEGNADSFDLNLSFQVNQQGGEWMGTHPSVYCTALFWGEGEGHYWPHPLKDSPHTQCVCPLWEGGRVGGRDSGTPLDKLGWQPTQVVTDRGTDRQTCLKRERQGQLPAQRQLRETNWSGASNNAKKKKKEKKAVQLPVKPGA